LGVEGWFLVVSAEDREKESEVSKCFRCWGLGFLHLLTGFRVSSFEVVGLVFFLSFLFFFSRLVVSIGRWRGYEGKRDIDIRILD
jgi:hypothetical protein